MPALIALRRENLSECSNKFMLLIEEIHHFAFNVKSS